MATIKSRPKNPDPSKVAILRTQTHAIPRILRVCFEKIGLKNLILLLKKAEPLGCFSEGPVIGATKKKTAGDENHEILVV